MSAANLDKKEIELFYKLWFSLNHGVNCRHNVIPQFKRPEYGKNMCEKEVFAVSEKLWEHPEWIDEFTDGNADLTDEERSILLSWRKHFVKDRFILERHLKKYSVLMSTADGEGKLYGVVGITDPLAFVLGASEVPCLIETVLLPFKGRIIYYGFVTTYSVVIGGNIRRSLDEEYNKIKTFSGIIETLEGGSDMKADGAEKKIRVNMATLESRLHEVNAITSGLKIFEAGNASFSVSEGSFRFSAKDKNGERSGSIKFTKDGRDVESFFCGCTSSRDGCLCKHAVAGILAVQGGVTESKISLGKMAAVSMDESRKRIAEIPFDPRKPSLSFLAAIVETATCKLMNDVLEDGQTSYGKSMSVEMTAKRIVAEKLSATAVIVSAKGSEIKFNISIADRRGEVCKGVHTRMVVDG
jgi:predicted thioesterase